MMFKPFLILLVCSITAVGFSEEKKEFILSAEKKELIVSEANKDSTPNIVKDGKRIRVTVAKFIEHELKGATGKYHAVAVPDG